MYSGPILWDAACNVHVRALCHASRTIYMEMHSCGKECFYRGYVHRKNSKYRSPIHKLPPAPKNVHTNARACDNVWYNLECVYHHHQRGLLCATLLYVSVGVVHKNMPYDGVQVHVRNNASACTANVKVIKKIRVCVPA